MVDLYDASTDWISIYDKSALPGFYMACGTSGNQYKNAPSPPRCWPPSWPTAKPATTTTPTT
ncbi:MAG: hypothetical protein Kilf2KO_24500 [Rhodospirillales bacterium]